MKRNESISVACNVVTKLRRKPNTGQASMFTGPFPLACDEDCSDITGESEVRTCTATFNGFSVEVSSSEDMRYLHFQGCHGKSSYLRGTPETILKQKKSFKKKKKIKLQESEIDVNKLNPQIEKMRIQEDILLSIPAETLTLSLEEAFFLSYYLEGVLKIVDNQNKEMEWSEFLAKTIAIDPYFLYHLAAYIHLKSIGWVVKSGLKFGSDFLIYKMGPHCYHGSYVVEVIIDEHSYAESRKITSLHRVAHANGKDLLLLKVDKPPNFDKLSNIMDITLFTVKEIMLRRFPATLYVQNQEIII